jgi:homopolymeric O-antigen transport system ATP-binding protein
MKPAIEIHNLSKRFRLGMRQAQYRTLRESLTEAVLGRWRRLRSCGHRSTAPPTGDADTLWALQNVSFHVQPGEVVGVIGRNGAGKSTLLKILSRITEPTTGRAEIRGRVGSLLEVGTGFHPELTGRENVYLNGSILGMTRKEIGRRFDEIVAFAELERFLETPVKRYSSGMYVRLAFAVAAHLELEVLIVDEVLAVGDATYQRKCIKRMEDIARSGRTVLFVSHNLDLIPRLCRTAIHLEKGELRELGPAKEVAESYLRALEAVGADGDLSDAFRTGDGRARFTRVKLGHDDAGAGTRAFHRSGDDLNLHFEIHSNCYLSDAAVAVNLRSLSGTRIHSAWTKEQEFPLRLHPGVHSLHCTFGRVAFRPGMTFEVELWLAAGEVVDHVPHALRVIVTDGPETSRFSSNPDQGFVLTPVSWAANGMAPSQAGSEN